ncbi:SOS response-associated peptidase family protein [Paraburkholderia nemoris]|uniref:SOS response-associated peptidase family protein n=1 Tax=Paraburkholderia nemoris TaxID=2793076 RepID=UPI0038BC414B
MCTNYAAARRKIFEKYFGVASPDVEWRDEVYQDYPAPAIRRGEGDRQALVGTFGMVPKSKSAPGGKHYSTMNARSETVGERPTYRKRVGEVTALSDPVRGILRTELRERQACALSDRHGFGEPFAIAGLWRAWPGSDGESLSCAMLTINADQHPLMKRFHKPGDEKRSIVIVQPDAYDD